MAGELWQEHGLVFASRVGTPLTANNVIRAFRVITKKAGLGEDWAPREMRRHTFGSWPGSAPRAWSFPRPLREFSAVAPGIVFSGM